MKPHCGVTSGLIVDTDRKLLRRDSINRLRLINKCSEISAPYKWNSIKYSQPIYNLITLS